MGISAALCAGCYWAGLLQIVSVKSLKERNDVLLRFDELPCPEYDRRVTHNKVRVCVCR